jgi:hypothetical protein
MRGFEKDEWAVVSARSDLKYVIHKKYQFIKFDLMKIQKGFNHMSPVWNVTTRKWTSELKTVTITVSYKKLTKDRIPEIFEKLLKMDNTKLIIFNYLFDGKYNTGRF